MIVSLLTASGVQTGKLSITVTPGDAAVEVTGPNGYTRSQSGGGTLLDLAPGSYRVTASAGGYSDTTSVNVAAGATATVSLAPGTGYFSYYVNDYRSPGEYATFSLHQGGNEVPGSRVGRMTTPGYTQQFGGFQLTLGQTYTLRVESERLGVRTTDLVPYTRPGGSNIIGVSIYQDGIGAG